MTDKRAIIPTRYKEAFRSTMSPWEPDFIYSNSVNFCGETT